MERFQSVMRNNPQASRPTKPLWVNGRYFIGGHENIISFRKDLYVCGLFQGSFPGRKSFNPLRQAERSCLHDSRFLPWCVCSGGPECKGARSARSVHRKAPD